MLKLHATEHARHADHRPHSSTPSAISPGSDSSALATVQAGRPLHRWMQLTLVPAWTASYSPLLLDRPSPPW